MSEKLITLDGLKNFSGKVLSRISATEFTSDMKIPITHSGEIDIIGVCTIAEETKLVNSSIILTTSAITVLNFGDVSITILCGDNDIQISTPTTIQGFYYTKLSKSPILTLPEVFNYTISKPEIGDEDEEMTLTDLQNAFYTSDFKFQKEAESINSATTKDVITLTADDFNSEYLLLKAPSGTQISADTSLYITFTKLVQGTIYATNTITGKTNQLTVT